MLHFNSNLQKFFKLALEEVQELLAARSNKPSVTQHFPVDFTRPETYEHLLREGGSEEPDELQDAAAAAAMQYPEEATAADAQQAGTGMALLAWLQQTAAMPGAACEVRRVRDTAWYRDGRVTLLSTCAAALQEQ